jgi:TonB-dependent starch-binding outer membrane protein SusC
MVQKHCFTRMLLSVMSCLLLLMGMPAIAQKSGVTVNGIIKNEKGEVMPGVSVKATHSTSGAVKNVVTNEKGVFTFNDLIPEATYNFTFSSVGYDAQKLSGYKLRREGSMSIAITLKESTSSLSQVVVIGYGNSSRKDLTGSITSVSADDFNRGVVSNPNQLLQGKVAGLNITTSGDPNGTASVILRGASTLRTGEAQQPLYVIDGIPGASIDLLAPDDIATIDVLKDASSTAIYGTRAANGVIMITTKKARPGQMRLTYNNYVATEKISNTIDMATAAQLRAYLAANGKALAPNDDDGANTNWQKVVSRNGFSHNHNLAFGGGTDNTTFGASVNYYKRDGIILGSSQERITGRISLEQRALDNKLKVNLSLADVSTKQQLIYQQDEVFLQMLRYLPTHVVYNPDGSFREDLSRTGNYNPLGIIKTSHDDQSMSVIQANAGASLELPFGIKAEVHGSIQQSDTTLGLYLDSRSVLVLNAHGVAQRSDYKATRKLLESFLTYGHTWGKHDLKLLAGYSWQQDKTGDGFQATNRNFISDETGYNNLGLGLAPAGYIPDYGTTTMTELRIISFFGRVNYNFADRYLFQASLRRDGSSAFGVNHRWGMFPAVSAAWRINKEPFMATQHIFDDLKFRIGYGVTGNSLGFDPLIATLRYGATGAAYYNGQFVAGIGPSQNANPDLKWEKTGMLNAGLDMAFLKNRLTVAFDVYDKQTKDLIWNYPVSSTLYYVSTLTANVGGISNRGVELVIGGTPVKKNGFEWNTSLNLAHNRNKVVSLSNNYFKLDYVYTADPEGLGQSNIFTQIIKAGAPVGQFYTLKYAGRNSDGISQFYAKDGSLTTAPQSTDQQMLGNAQPTLLYGFNNTFKYKGFDLNFFMRGVAGNKIMNATLAGFNVPMDAMNHNIPVFTLKEPFSDINDNKYSSRYLESGSYLRMDNATLGYTFPRIHRNIQALRIYVTAGNVFTITNYKGVDPEMDLGGLTPGLDNHNFYPKTRSFLAGLQVTL